MCVGIRSKMALCSSSIADIVFFRLQEHQFFSLTSEIEPLEAFDVFIDVVIDRFKRWRWATCRRRRAKETEAFTDFCFEADLGVDGKMKLRGFPPARHNKKYLSHRNASAAVL